MVWMDSDLFETECGYAQLTTQKKTGKSVDIYLKQQIKPYSTKAAQYGILKFYLNKLEAEMKVNGHESNIK